MPSIENVDQAGRWDGPEGDAWAESEDRHDAAVRAYNARLLDAAMIGRNDRVLDVGCGCGESTRGAARRSTAGAAVGVDLSTRMLHLARVRAREEGLTNVTFEHADAQVHRFAPATFDVVISRFGAMFFADPVAAFANLGSAVTADGRLRIMAWQPLGENEWLSELWSVLAMGRTVPVPPPMTPGPFGLAEPDAVRTMLEATGWCDVELEDVRESLFVGTDVDEAVEFATNLPAARGMLADLDPDTRSQAMALLRGSLAEHATARGVAYAAAAWLIGARRA